HGFGHEETAAESQGFPALREGPARVACFDDDRGVGEEGHRAVSHRETRRASRVSRGELRDAELLFHDAVLKGRVLLRIDLVEGRADDGYRAAALLDGGRVRRRIDAFR